jgi:hypothetical protein
MNLVLPPILQRNAFLGRLSRAPWAAIAEAVARAGYVARGVVYLSVAAIALLAALGLSPHAQGALGAIEAWGEWPAGVALLWLIGLGLWGFTGWRALQAIFDVDRAGLEPGGLASRAGQAVSGLVYGSLAVSVFGIIDALHDLHDADDHEQMRTLVAHVLQLPAGEAVAMALGLFILASGVGNMVRAFVDHFARNLDCDRRIGRWAGTLARIGYFCRGLAFLPAGAFTLIAGWHARAGEAKGVGSALDAMKALPFGHLALGVVALGLAAFGVFALLEASFRSIRIEAAMRGD